MPHAIPKKPVILTFVGNYLPGYKAGGILRSVVNTVDHLCDEFDFRIVTRDRDLGENTPFPNIKPNQWQAVGNASVYYLTPDLCTTKNILNVILNTEHDILFLNSFFDSFTVKILWNNKLKKGYFKPIIVSPRGEFAWASLKQKYPKKFLFIQAARLIGLYDEVTWHASSEYEAQDLLNIMKIKPGNIHIALDLPNKTRSMQSSADKALNCNKSDDLKVVFLSRISREKNLDFALKVLEKVGKKISFDIYGPKENLNYWGECEKIISRLPANVSVKYLGEVHPADVVDVLSRYDLFFFPSGGENYGHVIAESLSAGTPVLISTHTPWRNMHSDGLGWDVDLRSIDSFVEIIRNVSEMGIEERLKLRMSIRERSKKRLADPSVLDANRRLFKTVLLEGKQ
jgi:glycosyltransferase involved in cell wall biosynthesis